MKRILFFGVAAVLLLTGTVSADLMVYEYVPGEKVTLDTETGNFWYWNLADFVNMTYADQISAIDELGTYGDIAGGWHMANAAEMVNLWSNGPALISSRFSASSPIWQLLGYVDYVGRYDLEFDFYANDIDYHYVAYVSESSGYPPLPPGSLYMWDPDASATWWLSAWVTTDATVVPAPPAVVLATTGLLTGLLCMLGAKLRGQRR